MDSRVAVPVPPRGGWASYVRCMSLMQPASGVGVICDAPCTSSGAGRPPWPDQCLTHQRGGPPPMSLTTAETGTGSAGIPQRRGHERAIGEAVAGYRLLGWQVSVTEQGVFL